MDEILTPFAIMVLNDPAYLCDAIQIDDIRFVSKSSKREFRLDYSMYLQLIHQSYVEEMTFDRPLHKYISESMYAYYSIILLWKRIWQVLAARGIGQLYYHELEGRLPAYMPIPTDLEMYLSGIGDIVNPEFPPAHLDCQASLAHSPAVGGAKGSFGIIDAASHILYETIPSPLIALLRIRADLLLTTNHSDGSVDWDLPAGLRPVSDEFSKPTSNLLGWAKAERLTNEQLIALQNAQFDEESFGVKNIGHLPVNTHLFEWIGGHLENSRCRANSMESTSPSGTLAMIPFTTRVSADTESNGLLITGKMGVTESYTQLPGQITSSAATFRYRLKRSETGCVDGMCYGRAADHSDYPPAWIANQNVIFSFGVASDLWNHSQFELEPLDGKDMVASFAVRVRQ